MSDALKITSSHLARVAIVYLRQSSAAQVENNRESTDRQYALVNKATDLGWVADAPVSPSGPLRLAQIAVTRRCAVDNSIIGPDQAVTIDEALKAITVHAARHIGLEDSIGTLESGKEADLTILDSDPYKASPDAIADIKVSETWVAGERKFAA